jgi:hypothetical protein
MDGCGGKSKMYQLELIDDFFFDTDDKGLKLSNNRIFIIRAFFGLCIAPT